ncbi:MAG: PEP-CTERM sorting domain-containing protein [Bryobacteraceae bacterium]
MPEPSAWTIALAGATLIAVRRSHGKRRPR